MAGVVHKVVSSLAEYRRRKDIQKLAANEETVALLGHLTRLAEAGQLHDVFVGFRLEGEVQHAATGAFQNDATLARKLTMWLDTAVASLVANVAEGTSRFRGR